MKKIILIFTILSAIMLANFEKSQAQSCGPCGEDGYRTCYDRGMEYDDPCGHIVLPPPPPQENRVQNPRNSQMQQQNENDFSFSGWIKSIIQSLKFW